MAPPQPGGGAGRRDGGGPFCESMCVGTQRSVRALPHLEPCTGQRSPHPRAPCTPAPSMVGSATQDFVKENQTLRFVFAAFPLAAGESWP